QRHDRPTLRARGIIDVAARAAGQSVRLALVDQAKGVDMNVSLRALALASVTTAALVVAASAAAHARVSPPVALSKSGQLFTLAVPTEKEGKTTTKIVLTVPTGFAIDSFVPAPGR